MYLIEKLMLAQVSSDGIPVEVTGLDALSTGLFYILFFGGLYLLAKNMMRTNGRLPEWFTKDQWIYSRPWDHRDGLFLGFFFIAVVVVGVTVFTAILEGFLGGTDGNENLLIAMQSLIIQGLLIYGIVYLLRSRKTTMKEVFGIDRKYLKVHFVFAALYYITVMPIILLHNVGYHLYAQRQGKAVEMQEAVDLLTNTESPVFLLYFVVLAVVVAPIVEEIIFRGIAFPILSKRMGIVPAAVMVSVVFGMVHGQVHLVLPLAVLSFAMCLAFVRFRSLTVPIFIHMIFNGFTVLVILLGK